MSNEQCEAIIRAIELATTTIFLNGVKSWDRVGDSSTDGASRDAVMTTFSTEIENIINALPDPEP